LNKAPTAVKVDGPEEDTIYHTAEPTGLSPTLEDTKQDIIKTNKKQ